MSQLRKTKIIKHNPIIMSAVLILTVGFDQGALLYFRLRPVIPIIGLLMPSIRLGSNVLALSGALVAITIWAMLSGLSFFSMRLIGSPLTFNDSYSIAARSLYPWLLGLIPLLAFSFSGDYQTSLYLDNVTKLVAVCWSFSLWVNNVKMVSGLRTYGQAAAGILLALAAFVFMSILLAVAVVVVLGRFSQ